MHGAASAGTRDLLPTRGIASLPQSLPCRAYDAGHGIAPHRLAKLRFRRGYRQHLRLSGGLASARAGLWPVATLVGSGGI
jgi:hypothetical protein